MESLIKKLAIPGVILVWAAVYFSEVITYSERNQYLIKPVFFVMLALFVVNTFADYWQWRGQRLTFKPHAEGGKHQQKKTSQEEKRGYARIGTVLVLMSLYVAALPHLGFAISTVLLVLALLKFMRVNKLLPLCLVPSLLALFLYLVFKTFLGIPLPTGFLGF